MVSPDFRRKSPGIRPARDPYSAIEQLPQNLVHRLAVRLRRRVGLRRGRGRCRFGIRRLARHRNAALAVRPRRALTRTWTRTWAGSALPLAQAAQALLQQIAEGLAELAAEQIARLAGRSTLSAR